MFIIIMHNIKCKMIDTLGLKWFKRFCCLCLDAFQTENCSSRDPSEFNLLTLLLSVYNYIPVVPVLQRNSSGIEQVLWFQKQSRCMGNCLEWQIFAFAQSSHMQKLLLTLYNAVYSCICYCPPARVQRCKMVKKMAVFVHNHDL